jgi:hypothetical protein
LWDKNLSHYRPERLAPTICRHSALERGKADSPTHGPPLPPGKILGVHFCYRLSRPKGHGATGRIKSIENCYDPIGNQTLGLPTCSAVPASSNCATQCLWRTTENPHMKCGNYRFIEILQQVRHSKHWVQAGTNEPCDSTNDVKLHRATTLTTLIPLRVYYPKDT